MGLNEILVCDQCDLLLDEIPLEPGGKAACCRCGNILYRNKPNGLRLSLMFSITGAALFLVSNFFPIVTIDSNGLSNSTTLLDAPYRLVHDGIPSIAALVFATTFLMPALEILALIYLLFPLSLDRLPPGFSYAFRLVHFVKPWSMIEVFMLGLLVTITKLNAFASVVPDIALGSFVLLMFTVTAAAANFDPHSFWQRIEVIKAAQGKIC